MTAVRDTHVFVSYLREDTQVVTKLCDELRESGVEVWIDREKIRPGERWQLAIRRAIEDGAYFIACFSKAYSNRDKSYMNVELAIAVDQLSFRPADRAWFIPVVFGGGVVPDRPIRGGETLRDIQWVDLEEDWEDGLRRVIDVLRPTPVAAALPKESRAVIMMTDIVGSTNLSFGFGDGFYGLISDLSRAQAAAIDEYNGGTIVFTGDGLLATFESASDAISCAKLIRDKVAAFELGEWSGIRIGLSEGHVIEANDQVIGSVVNMASRICSLAEAGEILVTESVVRLSAGSQHNFQERGPVHLKGLSEAARIYEVF